MTALETYSRNGGQDILEEKEVIDEIREMPSIWTEYPHQRHYSDRADAFDTLGGWKTQVKIDLGPDHRPHNERLTPFLDAFHSKHRVAIEHEKKEQMRVRWHLMKMQAAHEREKTLDIDVGVLIYSTDEDPSLRRTRRELEGPFFTTHFPIHLSVYVLEYAPTDE